MDVLLQTLDDYVLDKQYARFLPLEHEGNSLSVQNATFAWAGHPHYEAWQLQSSRNIYLSQWPRDNIIRHTISLSVVTIIFGYLSYFAIALFSWCFLFDKTSIENNPRFRKNQVRREIGESLVSIPFMALLHVPFFVLITQGHSKLYGGNSGGSPGLWYDILSVPLFLVVTESMNYWIHRALHTPFLYKNFHKQHHKWVVATPFSGFAFHPLDGFLQATPYSIFIFIFPLHKWFYVIFFLFINIWTTIIHDGEYVTDSRVINGAACHTIHHQRLSHNYGQLFTFWDRAMGTHQNPNKSTSQIPQESGGEGDRKTK